MNEQEIKDMIKKAKDNKMYITKHAQIRSVQRGLSHSDILDAIDNIKRIIRIDIMDCGNKTYKIEGFNESMLAVVVRDQSLIVITAMHKKSKRRGRGKRD